MKKLIRELNSFRADMLRVEAGAGLRGLHETYRDSARNLIHYLALRRRDLRHPDPEGPQPLRILAGDLRAVDQQARAPRQVAR